MALIYVKDTSERYADPAALCSGSISSRVENGLVRKAMQPEFSANVLQFQSGNTTSYKAFFLIGKLLQTCLGASVAGNADPLGNGHKFWQGPNKLGEIAVLPASADRRR